MHVSICATSAIKINKFGSQTIPICMYKYVELDSCRHRDLIKHRYAQVQDIC